MEKNALVVVNFSAVPLVASEFVDTDTSFHSFFYSKLAGQAS